MTTTNKPTVHITVCPTCGRNNSIVNECGCDPDNLPTRPVGAVHCDNCTWTGSIDDVVYPQDLFERLTPGAEVPAGECPKCGALAYLVKPEPEPIRVIALVEGGVLQSARSTVPVSFDVADLDVLECDADKDTADRVNALAAEFDNLPHPVF